jgi:hypothetical protein
MASKAKRCLRRRKRAIFAAFKAPGKLQFDEQQPVTITAAKPDVEGEEPGLPGFEMVAYSGGKMSPNGWFADAPLIIDLAGMTTPKSGMMPVHRDHDPSQIVGHSTAIVAKTQLKVSGVISGGNGAAAEVVQSSRNGFPWQSSVGANLLSTPEFVPSGNTVFVNGRKHAGPVYVARKTRLFEASFVSLGADPRTSAVAATGVDDMEPKFREWLLASGWNDPDSLSATQMASLEAAFKADAGDDDEAEKPIAATKKTATLGGDDEETGSIAAAIRQRREAIAAEIAREAKITARLAGHPELAAKAVLDNWSEDKIELEYLRATAGRSPAVHVQGQVSDTPDAIEAALYLRGRIGSEADAAKVFGEKTVDVARKKCPRTPGIQYLMHQVLHAAGDHTHPAGAFDDATIRAAFRADRVIMASSGFSTISLSGTLSNLANKRLLASFGAVPSVFRRFSSTVGHSDFKAHTKYRVTANGRLLEVGPTGEIKHTDLDEEDYENTVKTYARMIALSRQMIRNDDLDEFLRLPAALGRMAAETLEHSVFEVLTNNSDSFFDATPVAPYSINALAAGAGSALSATSLAAAQALFWKQLNSDGKPINLVPSVLLVPPELLQTAENLVNRTTVIATGDPASTPQLQVSNQFQGMFDVAMSPYISAGTTGASATQWYLLASPSADVAVIEVAFLDNRQTPVIESAETDFNTLGMQWRAYMDWGVAKMERRAGVWSPGA